MTPLTHCSMCGAKSSDLSRIWPEPESLFIKDLLEWQIRWKRKWNNEPYRLWDRSVRSLGSGCVVCELIFAIFKSDELHLKIGNRTLLNSRVTAPTGRYLLIVDYVETVDDLSELAPLRDSNAIIITPLMNGSPGENHSPEFHSKCAFKEERYVPSRLLDIEREYPRLVLRTEVPYVEFVALSHCWGSCQPITTMIPFETLPATFQDAVKVTKSLGFQYIWIDSLCISSEMDKVYGNAELVLAAAAASSAHDGFLRDRPRPSTVHVSINVNPQFASLDFAHRLNPLDGRAWAFQEKFLAKRYLAYRVNELTWECCEDQFCEYSEKENIYSMLESSVSSNFQDIWRYVVMKYVQRKLTVPSDKFIAISAIASKYHSRSVQGHGNPQDFYAPSWSWASIDCNEIHIFSFDRTRLTLAHVLEASITSLTTDKFVPISDGLIRLHGKLLKAVLYTGIARAGFPQNCVEFFGCRFPCILDTSVVTYEHVLNGPMRQTELSARRISINELCLHTPRSASYSVLVFPLIARDHVDGPHHFMTALVLGPSPNRPGCFERLGIAPCYNQTPVGFEDVLSNYESSQITLV
ncbi:HET-domain-containing protein [Hypoxylon sp. FL1857]|nr:HET-domain-containing protein [Hypoxylon sp. FL1857]